MKEVIKLNQFYKTLSVKEEFYQERCIKQERKHREDEFKEFLIFKYANSPLIFLKQIKVKTTLFK